MEKEERAAFIKELTFLCGKYGIQNCAFCGTRDNKLEGHLLPGTFEEHSLKNFVSVVENTARLYQFARQSLFGQIDEIAK